MRDLPEMVTVEGAVLLMGSARGRPDEQPVHPVALSSFRAAVSPVTNAQYTRYLRDSGATPPEPMADPRFGAPGQPVVALTWHEAVAYCAWLSALTGATCRLPTEAEREFAALGGRSGCDWPWAGEVHPAAALIDAFDAPHAPLAECANGYGLRCMADNVHEWCADWYSADYYAVSPRDSPRGPDSGKRRVSRGGAWRHREKVTRVTARSSLDPSFRYTDFGFRVYADG